MIYHHHLVIPAKAGTQSLPLARTGGGKLLRDHHAQRRQVDLHRVPHMLRGNILVIVTIDVARTGHVLPRNRRVPRLQIFGQAARSFGDDFEAARHGIDRAWVGDERLVVETRCEVGGEVDVVRDVAQRSGRGARRHRWRRSWRPVERKASAPHG